MKNIYAAICLLLLCYSATSQPFTHADTLRGSNGPGRIWWDATKYNLHVKFNIEDSSIRGFNIISYKTLHVKEMMTMQIDLQDPLIIDSVFTDSFKLKPGEIRKDGYAYFFTLPLRKSNDPYQGKVTVYYHGKPKIAKNPPWDGGLIWNIDEQGRHWVTIACQGLGASVWYPCKDIQSDEPDSAEMHITAPSDLVAVSNGRERSKVNNSDGTTTTTWAVVNPINNYDLIPYMAHYVHFGEVYQGEKGPLTMNYWVLDYNLEKAKQQFQDATRMMKAFEYWFGSYPFYKDGYKLVGAPHLGMEHQSAVAYGNGYQNGYHGEDLSGTGWGLKWDFIIVHESGHEWFGNSITAKDIADMWIQEGFTNYSETLFTEYYYGKKAAEEYVVGIRKNILNKKPIISAYGVNSEGPVDMYYKAGNMIHTIRQVINDDSLFRKILRGLNRTFYHQTVTSKQVENYISTASHSDFSKVFDQYLRTIKVPVLEYSIRDGQMRYRWTDCVAGFNMPVKILNEKGEYMFIYPKDKWQQLKTGLTGVKADENFYIYTRQLN